MKKNNIQLKIQADSKFSTWKINTQHLIIVALIIIVILKAYRFLPSVYYLHDEWRALSDVFLYGIWTDIPTFSLIEIIFGKGRILGSVMNSIIYKYFPFDSFPFVISFYFLHFLNSYLLYLFIKKETNSKVWALSSSLLFATSSRYEQALSWIGAGNQNLASAFFSLLSIKILLHQKKSLTTFFLSFLIAYIGFLFKDASAFTMLIIIFGALHLWKHNRKIRFYISFYSLLFIIGTFCSYIIANIYSDKVHNTGGLGLDYIVSKGFFNIGFYPLVSLSQYIIPFRFMERLGYWLLEFNYYIMFNDGNKESIVHFILADYISIILSILLLLIGYVLLRKKTINKRLVYFSLFWFIATLIPISFRLINRYDSYINSLYMYYGGMPFWILIGGMITALYQYIQLLRFKKIITMLMIISFSLFIWKQIDITNREVRLAAIRGDDMRYFINEFNKKANKLPQKPVILLDSNQNYLLPETNIPFFLGDGFILSVLLYPTGKIPDQILAKRIFEGFGETGYIEQDDKGFGYYNDKATLLNDMKSGKFDKSQIVYWFYKGDEHILEDRTNEL